LASFTVGLCSGFALFGLSGYSLSEYERVNLIAGATATGAQLFVGAGGTAPRGNNVPEPMSALLVVAELGGLAVSRR